MIYLVDRVSTTPIRSNDCANNHEYKQVEVPEISIFDYGYIYEVTKLVETDCSTKALEYINHYFWKRVDLLKTMESHELKRYQKFLPIYGIIVITVQTEDNQYWEEFFIPVYDKDDVNNVYNKVVDSCINRLGYIDLRECRDEHYSLHNWCEYNILDKEILYLQRHND